MCKGCVWSTDVSRSLKTLSDYKIMRRHKKCGERIYLCAGRDLLYFKTRFHSQQNMVSYTMIHVNRGFFRFHISIQNINFNTNKEWTLRLQLCPHYLAFLNLSPSPAVPTKVSLVLFQLPTNHHTQFLTRRLSMCLQQKIN